MAAGAGGGGGGCTELRVGGRLVPGPRTGNGWARGRLIANAPSGPCYLCVTAVLLSASEDLTPGRPHHSPAAQAAGAGGGGGGANWVGLF
jgi:hypothetical protein